MTWCGIPATACAQPGTTHHKLAQAGIHQTFQPVTHQRGVRPFSGDALLLDGQLYSSLLPDELRDLPMPPRGAPRGRSSSSTRPSSTCGPGGGWSATPAPTPMAPPGGAARSAPACSAPGQFPKTMRTTEDRAARPRRRGLRAVLRRHPDRHAGRAALVAAHPVRHHRLAALHGSPPGRRVGQRRPQGHLRRSGPGVLPGHAARPR